MLGQGVIVATREPQPVEQAGTIKGTLEERENCLRVVSTDAVDYVIAWPHGHVWDVGGMGGDTFVVIRDSGTALVAKVGDVIQVPGVRLPDVDSVKGCDGPVWAAADSVTIVSARPDGVTSPSPTVDEMGAYALNFVREHYAEDRSRSPVILLSRAVTARDIYDLVEGHASSADVLNTRLGEDFCAGHPFPGSWYCDPDAAPFVVVVSGDWWTHAIASERLGPYLVALIDRRADNQTPIMVGYLTFDDGDHLRSIFPTIS